jgi:transposase
MGKKNRKSSSSPNQIEFNVNETEELIGRISSNSLEESDRRLLIGLVHWYVWVSTQLQVVRRGLGWLRKSMGIVFQGRDSSRDQNSQENASPPSGERGEGSSKDSSGQEASSSDSSPFPETQEKPAGHGRLGADAYWGAECVNCHHPDFTAESRCPRCGGKVFRMKKPAVEIRLVGSPLASATRYELERWRCSACGSVFTAPMPEEVSCQLHDETLRAILAIMHYRLGMPAHRIEGLQAALGAPLPDSTQSQLTAELADDCQPLYDALICYGAQSDLFALDDTGVVIQELVAENRGLSEKDRQGMHTTTIIAEGEHRVVLFFISRKHAGENLQEVLTFREGSLERPVQLSDALAANLICQEQTEAAFCWYHASRRFEDMEAAFPQESQWALETIREIFSYDAMARDLQFSESERLRFHNSLSAPLLNAFKAGMEERIRKRLIEPQGPLQQAFEYLLKRWEGFTLFLYRDGVPLSNNISERMLKIPIYHRRESHYFKTKNGARRAARMMSLIQTCIECGENPVRYLVTIQQNLKHMTADPAAWLPWNYQATLQTLS